MHELSIAQSVCDVALDHMKAGQRLKKVRLLCGPFSGIVPASLEFCFEIAANHNGVQGAGLEIETLSVPGTCSACGAVTEVADMWTPCERCGHAPLTVEGGRELRIINIEVEEVSDVRTLRL